MKTSTNIIDARHINYRHKTRDHLLVIFSLFLLLISSFPVFSQSFRVEPLTHPDGSFTTVALNNMGQIAGTVTLDIYTYHALRREPDGTFTELEEKGGNISAAYGMNELGHVVGTTFDAEFFGYSVVWEESGYRELEVPSGATIVVPVDINNAGIVVGYYFDISFFTHAVIWNADGSVQNLPEMDGIQSFPSAVNDSGQVVGAIQQADSVTTRAIMWQANNGDYTAVDLGTLGGPSAVANNINNPGQVVGFANVDQDGFVSHAFMWQDDEMIDLGTLGGINSNAMANNDDGFIVGLSQVGDSMLTKFKSSEQKSGILDKVLARSNIIIENEFIRSHRLNSVNNLAGVHEAFFAFGRRDMLKMNPFTANSDTEVRLSDAFAVSLPWGALGWSDQTGHEYYIINNQKRFISNMPSMYGSSHPGLLLYNYTSFTEAQADDTKVLPKMFLLAKPGTYAEDLTIHNTSTKVLGAFDGSGQTLRNNVPGGETHLNSLSVDEDAKAVLAGGINYTWTFDALEISGQFRTRPSVQVNIFDHWTLDGLNAGTWGDIKVGPAGKAIFANGIHKGSVHLDNIDFETISGNWPELSSGPVQLHNGNNSGAIGPFCRNIALATGSTGAYFFPNLIKQDDIVSRVSILFQYDSTPEKQEITVEAVQTEGLVKFDSSLTVKGKDDENIIIKAAAKAGWLIRPKSDQNNSEKTAQQVHPNIRVQVDSLENSGDPNLIRLLLFDCDGNLIGEAGTFLPADGNPPTSAAFTGYLDGILNITHLDVPLDTCNIIALGYGEVATAIDDPDPGAVVNRYHLSQNFPNPFNPRTVISWQLAVSSDVELSVYNLLGQKVATLVSGKQEAGIHTVQWNATGFASGVYYYRIEVRNSSGQSSVSKSGLDQDFVDVKKMVLLR